MQSIEVMFEYYLRLVTLTIWCRNLVHNYGPTSLAMYVPSDPVIYLDRIVHLCTEKRHMSNREAADGDPNASAPEWRSLFILIPMRLGVDKINPMYRC